MQPQLPRHSKCSISRKRFSGDRFRRLRRGALRYRPRLILRKLLQWHPRSRVWLKHLREFILLCDGIKGPSVESEHLQCSVSVELYYVTKARWHETIQLPRLHLDRSHGPRCVECLEWHSQRHCRQTAKQAICYRRLPRQRPGHTRSCDQPDSESESVGGRSGDSLEVSTAELTELTERIRIARLATAIFQAETHEI